MHSLPSKPNRMQSKILTRTLAALVLFMALAGFRPIGKPPVKVYVKNITIIYKKPATTGDGPTLYMKFVNGINKTQTYTLRGFIPLVQMECEKPDGSVFSLRNLQEDMTCSFALTLPPGQKDLIITQVGVTGQGWSMRINGGPEFPIEQKLTSQKL